MARTATSPAAPTLLPLTRAWALVPGVVTALGVALASLAIAAIERRLLGNAVVDALVVALVLAMIARLVWTPSARFEPGIRFASKTVLEVAVVLLGISVDFSLLARAGVGLAVATVAIVVAGLTLGVVIGRLLGLSTALAILVAVGNAICGNSAIAAVAPVIGAPADDVASSISFTAILGVSVVLLLPLVITRFGLSHYQYGVLAGLTVYAVPQVFAAAFPVSALAGEVATLVKLVRVLMLGPVVLFIGLLVRRARRDVIAIGSAAGRPRLPLGTLIPWFILGFVAVAGLRALGTVPPEWVAPTRATSAFLTVLAMAALGLSADLREVARAGGRVVAASSLSLGVLVILAAAAIAVLDIR